MNASSKIGASALMVVVVIGDAYEREYRKLFWSNHQLYCKKHNLDLLVRTSFIGAEGSDFGMQRLLVCSLPEAQDYEYVVYIDADILINITLAPSILDTVKSDLVSIVDEYSQPNAETRQLIQIRRGWETSAEAYYALAGFHIETERVFNTGVMVLQPAKHRRFLEELYSIGAVVSRTHERGAHYEPALLGSYLQQRGCFNVIDNRWNAIFALYCEEQKLDSSQAYVSAAARRLLLNIPFYRGRLLRRFFRRNYFIHLTGRGHRGLEKTVIDLGREE